MNCAERVIYTLNVMRILNQHGESQRPRNNLISTNSFAQVGFANKE